jgi:hypothetical protein
MIDIGNGNIFDVIDIDTNLAIESKAEFDRICKEGHAALLIDLGDTKYPVLITFLADYPDTPYTIHVLYAPLPLEQEKELLQKLKYVKGLKSIRSNSSHRLTKTQVNNYLNFLSKP